MVLTQYVVYEDPRDAPGQYVVREWHIVRGSSSPVVGRAWVTATAEDARALIPEGMICLDRDPTDDPVILEVWT